ncbi:hypothetical protein ACFFYR_10415 [Paraburkholderia dipogonis]|uniref:hypothetical protein n=1 Tax=Paraburkholderia dipogonis TaxID=1211383 RepID=UPI0035F0BAC1
MSAALGTAIGGGATVSGANSTAIGTNAVASRHSVALGNAATTTRTCPPRVQPGYGYALGYRVGSERRSVDGFGRQGAPCDERGAARQQRMQ